MLLMLKKIVPVELPKIVCLCGSTESKKHLEIMNKKLSLQGVIVLSRWLNEEDGVLTGVQKRILEQLHLRKIDLADEVYVITVNGCLDEATEKQIEYALAMNKTLIYYDFEQSVQPEKTENWLEDIQDEQG